MNIYKADNVASALTMQKMHVQGKIVKNTRLGKFINSPFSLKQIKQAWGWEKNKEMLKAFEHTMNTAKISSVMRKSQEKNNRTLKEILKDEVKSPCADHMIVFLELPSSGF